MILTRSYSRFGLVAGSLGLGVLAPSACSSAVFSAGDGGAEAGVADAGTGDAGFSRTTIPCGDGGRCDVAKGEVCCSRAAGSVVAVLSLPGASCKPAAACPAPDLAAGCDGPSDCEDPEAPDGGQVCCATLSSADPDARVVALQCTPMSGCDIGMPNDILCDPKAPVCPSGVSCGPVPTTPQYEGFSICKP